MKGEEQKQKGWRKSRKKKNRKYGKGSQEEIVMEEGLKGEEQKQKGRRQSRKKKNKLDESRVENENKKR